MLVVKHGVMADVAALRTRSTAELARELQLNLSEKVSIRNEDPLPAIAHIMMVQP